MRHICSLASALVAMREIAMVAIADIAVAVKVMAAKPMDAKPTVSAKFGIVMVDMVKVA